MHSSSTTQLTKRVKQHFIQLFESEPTLVFSPGRVNLIGGHTDYNQGIVLPAAITMGIVTGLSKSDNNHNSIIALDINEKFDFISGDIKPLKNGNWKNYILGIVAEIKNTGRSVPNFNMAFAGNIPEGAGLSSSAALENSLVYGLNALFDLGLSKKEMIFISQKAEHHFAGVKCGIMDQFASMFGKKDHVLLLDCKNIEATPYPINLNQYELLLINTHVKHKLADTAYNNRRATCENISHQLKIASLREITEQELKNRKHELPQNDYPKALYIVQENNRVMKAARAIATNDLLKFGELLFQSHIGLQKQYQVSCAELDFLVDLAQKTPGVTGSRMMGGGFGGCTISLLHKSSSEAFKKFTKTAYKEHFKKDCSFYSVELSEGTGIIT